MVDLDLADAEAARSRQHGDEPVQLAVEPHLAEHLGPIALEPAIVVVEMARPVSQLTIQLKTRLGSTLCQGSCRAPLPAADDVDLPSSVREEPGNLGRVVLEVAVEGEDDLAAAGRETRGERRRLAEVPPEADAPDPRILGGKFADHVPRIIAAPVVDENHLDVERVLPGRLVDLAQQLREAVALD